MYWVVWWHGWWAFLPHLARVADGACCDGLISHNESDCHLSLPLHHRISHSRAGETSYSLRIICQYGVDPTLSHGSLSNTGSDPSSTIYQHGIEPDLGWLLKLGQLEYWNISLHIDGTSQGYLPTWIQTYQHFLPHIMRSMTVALAASACKCYQHHNNRPVVGMLWHWLWNFPSARYRKLLTVCTLPL